MKKTAHIRVYGIVQGVGMRYSVYRKALSLDLTGYVMNMPDGSVEIEAEGEEESILSLIDYVKNGVRWAQVDKVEVEWRNYEGKYKEFEIRGW